MLILDKPRRFEGDVIALPNFHRSHLSLFPGSWVYIVLLPGRDLSRQCAEIVLSTISEDCWHDLWRITATFHDKPGLVNDLTTVLADHRVNILTAESSSLERESFHSIELICDAHRYQTSHSDHNAAYRHEKKVDELRDLKRSVIAALLPDLALDSSGEPAVKIRRMKALFQARLILDDCEIAYQEGRSKFRPSRSRAQIEKKGNGRFYLHLPREIVEALEPMISSQARENNYLLVSDTKDRLLRCHFIPAERKTISPTIQHSESPGAIAEITGALRKNQFNILTMLSRLDEHRRTAETEFVLTTDAAGNIPQNQFEATLSHPDLADLNIKIDYPYSYSGRPAFKPLTAGTQAYPSNHRSPNKESIELLDDLVNRYEQVSRSRRASQEDLAKFKIATRLHSEEAMFRNVKPFKRLFISCAYRESYILQAKKIATELGFRVITGEELESDTKRGGVLSRIRAATHFLGIWTTEGGFPIHDFNGLNHNFRYTPSPWMLWELGVAHTLGLEVSLAISKEIFRESWSRIVYDPVHFMFDGADFEATVTRAISYLATISQDYSEIPYS